jgi:drug/metabolite transporter (DMT)-like permease
MTTNVKTKIPVPASATSRQARALLIGATLLWGASFPLLRGLQLTQEQHGPHVADSVLACADVAVRFGAAALVLLPFFLRDLIRVTALEWSQALGLGALAGVGLYLQTLGLAWTDASISAFLTQLGTLIVPLIVAVRDRRRPSGRILTACVMVLAGTALLSPGLLTHFILGPGEMITLFSAFFFAGQIVWVERPIYANNRSGMVTLIMLSLISLIFCALYPLLGGNFRTTARLFSTGPIDVLMLILVLFCTIFSFFIMNRWQRFVAAVEAGLIYCLEPVLATVFAAFVPGWISHFAGINYPNESLRWGLVSGGSLILGAALLARRRTEAPEEDIFLVR